MSINEEQLQGKKASHSCFLLRDVSSMETIADEPEVRKDHVTSGGCADDVSVLDTIETCHGVRPVLVSDHFVDRRQQTSGT